MAATRLTQNHRRISKGGDILALQPVAPKTPHLCRKCGKPLNEKRNRTCGACAIADSRENLLEAAKLGRIITHLPAAQALRAATQRKHGAARKTWNPLDMPDWLNARFYRDKILPALKSKTVSAIASALGVCGPYATDIRAGRRVPHQRHWKVLAELVIQP